MKKEGAMLDGTVFIKIGSGVGLSQPVDGRPLHADVEAGQIADGGEQRQILPVGNWRPVTQKKRHQDQRADPHNHVSKKNRISGWKDAAKHYWPSSIMCRSETICRLNGRILWAAGSIRVIIAFVMAREGKVLTTTPTKSTSLPSLACSRPNYFLKAAASAEGSNEFRSSREKGFLSASVSNDTKRLLSLGQLASIARQRTQVSPSG